MIYNPYPAKLNAGVSIFTTSSKNSTGSDTSITGINVWKQIFYWDSFIGRLITPTGTIFFRIIPLII